MPRQLRIQYENAFYHVMARGFDKRNIFCSEQDFNKFLEICTEACARFNFVCHAFCVMSNHYHLFIQTPEANLSEIMRNINGRYAVYFLKQNPGYIGYVFQGRYHRILVESDAYSKLLVRYIHLNPVVAKIVLDPSAWQWSSFQSYLSGESSYAFLELDWVLGQFSTNPQKAISDFLEYTCKDINVNGDWQPEDHTHHELILGSKSFADSILEKYANYTEINQCERQSSSSLKQAVKRLTSQGIDEFIVQNHKKVSKTKLGYFIRKHSSLTYKEIAQRLGLKASSLKVGVSRLNSQNYDIDLDFGSLRDDNMITN